jgi:hypothetical protein
MNYVDFLFCAIVVIITNYAAAEKKTTVTGDVTKDKGSGTRADFGISHKWGNWKFDGSGFSTSKGHRGGSLPGVSNCRSSKLSIHYTIYTFGSIRFLVSDNKIFQHFHIKFC